MKPDGEKRYNIMYRVGRIKYLVSFHDGIQEHKDGSPFFDIKIFRNIKDLEKFEKELLGSGYKYGYSI